MIDLTTPISQITSIGKQLAPKLKKLGIITAGDLLQYWPFRWEDWSKIKLIKDIEPNTNVTIKGQIELIQNKRSKWQKKLITEAIVSDGQDQVKCVWFHQPYLVKNLQPGDHLYLSGKAEAKTDGLQFIQALDFTIQLVIGQQTQYCWESDREYFLTLQIANC